MTARAQVRDDRYGPWLVAGGLLAALAQPLLLGFIGTAIALGCAVALAVRGHRLPAVAVAAITALVLFAFLLFVGVVGGEVETGGDFGP
jgi:fumarate reductase subunit D